MAARRTDRGVRITFTPPEDAAPMTIEWRDGKLIGDDEAVALIENAFASSTKVVAITPTGPYLREDEVFKKVEGVVRFIQQEFEAYGDVAIQGDLPTLDYDPDAIY